MDPSCDARVDESQIRLAMRSPRLLQRAESTKRRSTSAAGASRRPRDRRRGADGRGKPRRGFHAVISDTAFRVLRAAGLDAVRARPK